MPCNTDDIAEGAIVALSTLFTVLLFVIRFRERLAFALLKMPPTPPTLRRSDASTFGDTTPL